MALTAAIASGRPIDAARVGVLRRLGQLGLDGVTGDDVIDAMLEAELVHEDAGTIEAAAQRALERRAGVLRDCLLCDGTGRAGAMYETCSACWDYGEIDTRDEVREEWDDG